MSRIKNVLLLSSCLLSIATYGIAAANNQASTDKPSEWNIKIGGGLITDSQAWNGIDTEVSLVPFVEANIGNWYFNFENPISYQAELENGIGYYAGIGLRNNGYESSDFAINDTEESATFQGYQKPDNETVIDYGVSLHWFAIDASTDVSNKSESNTLSFTVKIPIYDSTSGMSISTSASAHWMDAEYVNYYYGVEGAQVNNAVGRTNYQSTSATNYEIAINAMYPINSDWVLLGKLSHTLLADEISESPLVDTDYQDEAMLLVIYQY